MSENSKAFPVRVQRKRTKGYRLPPNTVSVTRPHAFGNPYRIGDLCTWNTPRLEFGGKGLADILREAHGRPVYQTAADTVWGFKEMVISSPKFQRAIQDKLKGKNLACFCRLGHPCHAQILLEYANPEKTDK